MASPQLDNLITTYTGPKNPAVGRVGWSQNTVWLDAAATKRGQPATPGTIGFRGVPEAVWNFHIGGYQVCERWLKDRKGRTLAEDDIAHYQKIVVALAETIRLMRQIDEVIEQHGGWPGAFAQRDAEARETADTDNVVPLPRPKPPMFARQAGPLPLQKVAEPEAQRYEAADASAHGATRLDTDGLDQEDMICRVRHMFGDGEQRERDAAIGALVRELGYPGRAVVFTRRSKTRSASPLGAASWPTRATLCACPPAASSNTSATSSRSSSSPPYRGNHGSSAMMPSAPSPVGWGSGEPGDRSTKLRAR